MSASWADKTNNSIAYCVLAGPNGPDSGSGWAPWKAHSSDGSTATFTATVDADNYTDFVIELLSPQPLKLQLLLLENQKH